MGVSSDIEENKSNVKTCAIAIINSLKFSEEA